MLRVPKFDNENIQFHPYKCKKIIHFLYILSHVTNFSLFCGVPLKVWWGCMSLLSAVNVHCDGWIHCKAVTHFWSDNACIGRAMMVVHEGMFWLHDAWWTISLVWIDEWARLRFCVKDKSWYFTIYLFLLSSSDFLDSFNFKGQLYAKFVQVFCSRFFI